MGFFRGSPHLEYAADTVARVFTIRSVQLLSDVAEELAHDFTRAWAAPGPRHAIVNLEDVTYLSSVAVTSLLTLRKQARAAGGEMVVCGLTPPVVSVLRMCKLIAAEGSSEASVLVHAADVAAARRRLTGICELEFV
jgi:anti-anti-sigma factor